LKARADSQKRLAEEAQSKLDIQKNISGIDSKALEEEQKRVQQLVDAANASAQEYNNQIAEL